MANPHPLSPMRPPPLNAITRRLLAGKASHALNHAKVPPGKPFVARNPQPAHNMMYGSTKPA